jgi:hypothetical protein
MLTVRYGDARQARSADSEGAVQVSKPSPLTRVALEADGYLTGVSGSAAAGPASPSRIAAVTAPVAAARPARRISTMTYPLSGPAPLQSL